MFPPLSQEADGGAWSLSMLLILSVESKMAERRRDGLTLVHPYPRTPARPPACTYIRYAQRASKTRSSGPRKLRHRLRLLTLFVVSEYSKREGVIVGT